MDSNHKIKAFVESGRNHLNAGERKRIGVWSLLIFAATAVLASLPFVLRGFRVDRRILCIPLLAAVIVAVVFYLRQRYSHRKAVRQADRFFKLKEGLITADEHIREDRSEEIHRLQLHHTERLIESHDTAQLRGSIPRKGLVSALLLLALVGGLLALEDSLAVKQARAEIESTRALTEKLGEELGEALEELIKEMEKESMELIEDPTLKQMLRDLPADGDRKAVMRRLAEIDQHLAKMQSELDTRADENYLAELAEQLRQSRETSALAKALAQRKYKEAAAEMENMKLGSKNEASKLKALEKLASKIEQTEKSMSSTESGSRRDAQEMSKQIQQMQREQKNAGQSSQESRSKVNQSIGKNSQGMKQLGARKEARSGLDKLRDKLQQGQGKLAGNGKKPGENPGGEPGGKGAGEGVDRSRRNLREKTPIEGTLDHLSGQLGEGESEKRIENAASGAGVASDPGAEKAVRGYRQQVEAFVQREDVPEEMKHGVKTYFEQIHNVASEAGAEPPE